MRSSFLLAVACTISLLAPVSTALGQAGAFVAPTSAMDTLNSAPAGGGLNPSTFTDRANAVAAQAQQGPGGFTPPAGGPGGGGFVPPAGFQAIDPTGGGGAPGAPGAPGGFPTIPSFTGIGGQRVVSALNRSRVLQDARQVRITQLAIASLTGDGRYYDDGVSGNDAAPGDGIYTNVSLSDDYIAPDEFAIKTRLLNLMRAVEGVDGAPDAGGGRTQAEIPSISYLSAGATSRGSRKPIRSVTRSRGLMTAQEFFGVAVATNDPVTTLPRLVDLEKKRDEKLKDWADRFLRDFRVNPESLTSPFIPAWLPFPPKAPSLPLPATFTTKAAATPARGEGGGSGPALVGGKTLDDDVTGDPSEYNPAASSRYF